MNFADIANKKLADIERPPLAPPGMYRWQIVKIPTSENVANDAYTNVTFTCKAVEAYDSVDADDLAAFGGIKNVASQFRFLFDNNDATKFDQTLFRLRTFLEKHLAIDGAEKMSLNEAMNAAVNQQFDGNFFHRPDKNDKELFYGEIQKTAPVRE